MSDQLAENDAADPRIQIERIGEHYNLFRVTIDGEQVDDWATGDEVLAYVSDALSSYVTSPAKGDTDV